MMDEDLIHIIINEFWEENKIFIRFPIDIFKSINYKKISLYVYSIAIELECLSKVEWLYDIMYNNDTILLYRKDFVMKAEFIVQIPYRERSKYFDIINKINFLIGTEGMCGIAVNNNPYSLDSILIVETKNHIVEIEEILNKSNLKRIHNKGVTEIVKEMSDRKWLFHTFPLGIDTTELMKIIFKFPETHSLETKGYNSNLSQTKKKVFISYCHKDKQEIHSIVEKFEIYGLNVWLDEKAIDIGDNIIEKMSSGIRECDIAVIFLSCHTINAKNAMYELVTFIRSLIAQEKKVMPILLDNVNPDDIVYGLGGYKYYPYFEKKDTQELIMQIKRILDKV